MHIIKLEERKQAHLLPLDEVREQLREHMIKQKLDTVEADEKTRLREQARIEILIPLERAEKK